MIIETAVHDFMLGLAWLAALQQLLIQDGHCCRACESHCTVRRRSTQLERVIFWTSLTNTSTILKTNVNVGCGFNFLGGSLTANLTPSSRELQGLISMACGHDSHQYKQSSSLGIDCSDACRTCLNQAKTASRSHPAAVGQSRHMSPHYERCWCALNSETFTGD